MDSLSLPHSSQLLDEPYVYEEDDELTETYEAEVQVEENYSPCEIADTYHSVAIIILLIPALSKQHVMH